jgi:hypothetical protein
MAGVALGVVLTVFRSSLEPWRGIDFVTGDAAIAGVAVACAWGLVLCLDIATERWWTAGLVGVGATSMLVFASTEWSALAAMFLLCLSIAVSVALVRASPFVWLIVVVSDVGLASVLLASALEGDRWATSAHIEGVLLVPFMIALGLRIGLVPRLGSVGTTPTEGAAVAPLVAGSGLVAGVRWLGPPDPSVATGVLVLIVVVVGWSVVKRRLDPSILSCWTVGLAAALLLASERARVPASIGALLGLSVLALWPDAQARGRLSRGLLLSCLAPGITFAAVALAAADSFRLATSATHGLESVAWVAVSALIPVAFASGVALGVVAARSRPDGGYHPEAVAMTWTLLGASVVAGLVIGPGRVYAGLGGGPAVILFVIALIVGAAAAWRWGESEAGSAVRADTTVVVGGPIVVGRWTTFVAFGALLAASGAVATFVVQGLRVGFL